MSTVAKYLRLSNEDQDKPDSSESVSIVNQRHLLNSYLDSHSEFAGWERIEFCDDGWSGTNFDRPGIKELLELVRKGNVQCIIVKDLSRFGRNYLTVGDWISRVLPFLGVRFISLSEKYDSARPEDLNSLGVSFSTILHDLYSKELSGKVREAKDRLARKGEFLAAAAPYGYSKDPGQAKHLIVDPVAGKTIRYIFDMICAGQGTRAIAQRMNAQEILTPMCYKHSQGEPWQHSKEEYFWTSSMVAKIIRDERYTGCSIYGKRRRDAAVSGKRTVKAPRDQWIITEGTHEALVSKEQFREAQKYLRKYRGRDRTGETAPLARKVYCGCCGRAMAQSSGERRYYYCKTRRFTDRFSCGKDRIPERDLIDVALATGRVFAQISVEPDELLLQMRRQAEKKRKRIRQKFIALQNRKAKTERELQALYERLVEEGIDREVYSARKKSLSQQLESLSINLDHMAAELSEPQDRSDIAGKDELGEWLGFMEEENIRHMVDRITIYPGNVLDVLLCLNDECKQ